MRATITAAAFRKLGQAHLRAGRFTKAKELLGEALAHPRFPEAANARTDLGLAEAGFRSLDFLLPKDDAAANETTIRAVERQIECFQQATTEEGRPTNAHFVLGIIAVHRNRLQEAEEHLTNALAGMLLKEQAYQTARLVDWVRFLVAISIAEQCQPARLQEVRGLAETGMASDATFPLSLWARLLRAAAVYDDKSLAEAIIQHLLDQRGDAAYTLLKETGLLLKNATFRTGYRRWLDTRRLSPADRATELRALLDVALKAGSIEEATDLLDALEGTAKNDAKQVPHFLALIRERRSDLLMVWDEADLDNTETGLLERLGRLDECAELLQRVFYRYRVDGDWDAAQEVLEDLSHLKVTGLPLDLLGRQIEHLRPTVAAPASAQALSLAGIRVLYVGGNETQIQYETAIERNLAQKHPGLSVSFYFPGWTSNWNVHLEKLKRLLPQHDVVVLNRFVRTQLGRKLRAACGATVPWRACTGHGRDSLTRAIEAAAAWTAAKRSRQAVQKGAAE